MNQCACQTQLLLHSLRVFVDKKVRGRLEVEKFHQISNTVFGFVSRKALHQCAGKQNLTPLQVIEQPELRRAEPDPDNKLAML